MREVLDVSTTVWIVTVIGIIGLLAFDFFFHVRVPHEPTLKESSIWSAIYVGFAVAFGIGFWMVAGSQFGQEYFAGYLTEKALSMDNVFVFLVILTSFKVPREHQQKVLLFGIIFALISRTIFIALGAAMIERFSWTFYLFGLILLWTAVVLLLKKEENKDASENGLVKFAKKHYPTTDEYHGDKYFVKLDGKRHMTPLMLVMIAIGGTDILFALDSIPAIYGLTETPYIVFTANAFALMGLRQLFFLIDGLLERLIYLSYGLSLILAFIGVKLMFHALKGNTLPFINGGEAIKVPEISVTFSLGVILGILFVTVVVSLLSPKGRAMAKHGKQDAQKH